MSINIGSTHNFPPMTVQLEYTSGKDRYVVISDNIVSSEDTKASTSTVEKSNSHLKPVETDKTDANIHQINCYHIAMRQLLINLFIFFNSLNV